jgi:hypothetical protein
MQTEIEKNKRILQHEKDLLIEKIEHFTYEIDKKINQLYNLSPEEIEIIEKNAE